MMWWNDYGPGPWMFFGPMFMILFFIACVGMMFFYFCYLLEVCSRKRILVLISSKGAKIPVWPPIAGNFLLQIFKQPLGFLNQS